MGGEIHDDPNSRASSASFSSADTSQKQVTKEQRNRSASLGGETRTASTSVAGQPAAGKAKECAPEVLKQTETEALDINSLTGSRIRSGSLSRLEQISRFASKILRTGSKGVLHKYAKQQVAEILNDDKRRRITDELDRCHLAMKEGTETAENLQSTLAFLDKAIKAEVKAQKYTAAVAPDSLRRALTEELSSSYLEQEGLSGEAELANSARTAALESKALLSLPKPSPEDSPLTQLQNAKDTLRLALAYQEKMSLWQKAYQKEVEHYTSRGDELRTKGQFEKVEQLVHPKNMGPERFHHLSHEIDQKLERKITSREFQSQLDNHMHQLETAQNPHESALGAIDSINQTTLIDSTFLAELQEKTGKGNQLGKMLFPLSSEDLSRGDIEEIRHRKHAVAGLAILDCVPPPINENEAKLGVKHKPVRASLELVTDFKTSQFQSSIEQEKGKIAQASLKRSELKTELETPQLRMASVEETLPQLEDELSRLETDFETKLKGMEKEEKESMSTMIKEKKQTLVKMKNELRELTAKTRQIESDIVKEKQKIAASELSIASYELKTMMQEGMSQIHNSLEARQITAEQAEMQLLQLQSKVMEKYDTARNEFSDPKLAQSLKSAYLSNTLVRGTRGAVLPDISPSTLHSSQVAGDLTEQMWQSMGFDKTRLKEVQRDYEVTAGGVKLKTTDEVSLIHHTSAIRALRKVARNTEEQKIHEWAKSDVAGVGRPTVRRDLADTLDDCYTKLAQGQIFNSKEDLMQHIADLRTKENSPEISAQLSRLTALQKYTAERGTVQLSPALQQASKPVQQQQIAEKLKDAMFNQFKMEIWSKKYAAAEKQQLDHLDDLDKYSLSRISKEKFQELSKQVAEEAEAQLEKSPVLKEHLQHLAQATDPYQTGGELLGEINSEALKEGAFLRQGAAKMTAEDKSRTEGNFGLAYHFQNMGSHVQVNQQVIERAKWALEATEGYSILPFLKDKESNSLTENIAATKQEHQTKVDALKQAEEAKDAAAIATLKPEIEKLSVQLQAKQDLQAASEKLTEFMNTQMEALRNSLREGTISQGHAEEALAQLQFQIMQGYDQIRNSYSSYHFAKQQQTMTVARELEQGTFQDPRASLRLGAPVPPSSAKIQKELIQNMSAFMNEGADKPGFSPDKLMRDFVVTAKGAAPSAERAGSDTLARIGEGIKQDIQHGIEGAIEKLKQDIRGLKASMPAHPTKEQENAIRLQLYPQVMKLNLYEGIYGIMGLEKSSESSRNAAMLEVEHRLTQQNAKFKELCPGAADYGDVSKLVDSAEVAIFLKRTLRK